ncbi:MFS transporter [Kitasatospora sp. MMS16-BH015]|uniref:MFS transporter n=1 Tax=Kitasatospora sp. MMS16-BH015 TaxID=2018025 RepID=UPI000CA1F169|nr:MFS transporter [Kitasatospora sp. MMS16-BH015]AUG75282.1 MFS transporter [Kitasatospora sp. MMS16-BH015]
MPARKNSTPFGADFHKLWAASAISTLGDGITMAAGPLLVASLTHDPAPVALAVFFQQLPWLLFGLVSGVYVDRLDRRRLVVAVNLVRATALAALATAAALQAVHLPFLYAVLFLLGTADTLADTASSALLPSVVARGDLAEANARLSLTFSVGNQFLAKPLGAWLFALAAAAPFATDALTFAAAAALTAALRPRTTPAPPSVTAPRERIRTDLTTGVRWLARQPLLRALTLTMAVGNLFFCAAFATFVLYAHRRLGLSGPGYGLLLTTFALGGTLGTLTVRRLRHRWRAATLLRAGLLVETATHAALAATTRVWLAAPVLVLFGVHTMVWGSIAATLHQRATPDQLRGRVGSVRTLADLGSAALGSLFGALLTRHLALTTPFWLAAAAMLLTTACAWRPLSRAALD